MDITKQVQTYQLHSRVGAHPVPIGQLQQIATALLSDARGIGGLTFSVGKTAVTTQELPQFLASLKMNPQQLTSVIYGLYKEVREKGTLSPGADNMIHLDESKLAALAKSDAIQSELSLRALSMQRGKSIDPLFARSGSPKRAANLPPSVPYGINSNHTADTIVASDSDAPAPAAEHNSVPQPKALLSSVLGAYISKADISEACNILFPEGGIA